MTTDGLAFPRSLSQLSIKTRIETSRRRQLPGLRQSLSQLSIKTRIETRGATISGPRDKHV